MQNGDEVGVNSLCPPSSRRVQEVKSGGVPNKVGGNPCTAIDDEVEEVEGGNGSVNPLILLE